MCKIETRVSTMRIVQGLGLGRDRFTRRWRVTRALPALPLAESGCRLSVVRDRAPRYQALRAPRQGRLSPHWARLRCHRHLLRPHAAGVCFHEPWHTLHRHQQARRAQRERARARPKVDLLPRAQSSAATARRRHAAHGQSLGHGVWGSSVSIVRTMATRELVALMEVSANLTGRKHR